MDSGPGNSNVIDAYDASRRAWERDTSRMRQFSARIGLQGKLLLCFMGLLTLALGASCLIYISQTAKCLQDILGEQAQQVASALAWSTEDSIALPDHDNQLLATASNLIKSRNV